MSNEIKSEKLYIKDIFKRWYRIPEYQRPYVWGKDQINDLLDDIDQNIKKEANTIDIFPIIWENILVEKPTRAIHKSCEKIIICGDGWTFDNKLN